MKNRTSAPPLLLTPMAWFGMSAIIALGLAGWPFIDPGSRVGGPDWPMQEIEIKLGMHRYSISAFTSLLMIGGVFTCLFFIYRLLPGMNRTGLNWWLGFAHATFYLCSAFFFLGTYMTMSRLTPGRYHAWDTLPPYAMGLVALTLTLGTFSFLFNLARNLVSRQRSGVTPS